MNAGAGGRNRSALLRQMRKSTLSIGREIDEVGDVGLIIVFLTVHKLSMRHVYV